MGDGAAVGTTIAPVYCCGVWAVPNCMLPDMSLEVTDLTAWPGTTTPIPLLVWYSRLPPPPAPKPLPALTDGCFNVAVAGDDTSSSPRTRFIANHIGRTENGKINDRNKFILRCDKNLIHKLYIIDYQHLYPSSKRFQNEI